MQGGLPGRVDEDIVVLDNIGDPDLSKNRWDADFPLVIIGCVSPALEDQQLLNTGRESEVSARLKTEAILRCEAKMAEIVAGIEQAVSATDETFPDDEIGHWHWSADVGSGSAISLLQITVIVEHLPDGKNPNAAFTLTRYMRDPQLFIDAALSEAGE